MAIPAQLIERLTALTQQRKLNWEEFAIDTFRTATGGANLTVRFNWPSFALSIYDENGSLIGRQDEPEGSNVASLYEAARRYALDVDRKLEALGAALEKLDQR